MIRSILVALLWLNFGGAIAAQAKPPSKLLELTAEIVSQSYCAASQNSASLELKLKLRFRNIGNQKLILYRGHDLFYQTKIRSAPGNPSGPYDVWVVNSRYFDQEVEAIDQTSPSKVFITLSPGATYLSEIEIGVGIVNEKVDRGDSSIRSGDHTLQLIASTWYQSRAMAQKLRQEWQRKGLLWSDPLDARPIHFLVQRPSVLVPCKSSN
ncbi:MAG TPA: hypothetical protein VK582_08315 [Pyrinomonadaceae bacterium]|nr:hypothetical protein [Pyrinomonadaceae bacterium]